MPPLTRALAATTVLGVSVLALGGCRKKADRAGCDELVARFAELVVRERMPDAGEDVVRAERARELVEARRSDAFRSCTTEVQESELACALRAPTSDALLACLE